MIRTVALFSVLALLVLGGTGAVPAPFAPPPPQDRPAELSRAVLDLIGTGPVSASPGDSRDGLFGRFAEPTLTPRADGALVARGEHYAATFENDRFSMRRDGRGFDFVLEDVTADGASLLSPAAGPVAGDLKVEYRRGRVIEEYEIVDKGVEQNFRVLEGSGEIVVRGRLETSLAVSPCPDRGSMGLKLSDGVRDVIQFCRVTILDAAGRSMHADIELARDDFEIHVPAHFTAAAEFPILIDPLIGPIITVETAAGEPSSLFLRGRDIAYNATGDQYLVVWSKVTATAPTTQSDVFGQRYTSAGAPIGGVISIDTFAGAQGVGAVSVATNPANNEWYVVWGDDRDLGTLDNEIYGNTISSGGAVNYAPAFKVSDTAGLVSDAAPDIVHEGPDLIVAWFTAAGGDNTVVMRRIDQGAAPTTPPAGVGGSVVLGADPVLLDFRVSLGFMTGFGTVCAWTRSDAGFTAMDILTKLIPPGGAPPVAATVLTPATVPFAAWSDVAGDPANSQFYVSWAHDDGLGSGINVVGRLLTGAGVPLGAGQTLVIDQPETLQLTRTTYVPLREQFWISYERLAASVDIEAMRIQSCDLVVLEGPIVLAATANGDRDPCQAPSGTLTQTLTAWWEGSAVGYVGTFAQRFDFPNDSICALGPLTINTPCPLTAGTVGLPYTALLTGSGGSPPYTWSITVGALPPGLTLNAASGLISGTPTTPGTFAFTITLTDSVPTSTALACTLTINAAPVAGGGAGQGNTRGGGGARGWLPCSVFGGSSEDDGSVLPAALLLVLLAGFVRLLARR